MTIKNKHYPIQILLGVIYNYCVTMVLAILEQDNMNWIFLIIFGWKSHYYYILGEKKVSCGKIWMIDNT